MIIRHIFGDEDSPDGFTMSTRNQFSYHMFLWDWERLREFQYWPVVDDLFNRLKAFKSANKLEFISPQVKGEINLATYLEDLGPDFLL